MQSVEITELGRPARHCSISPCPHSLAILLLPLSSGATKTRPCGWIGIIPFLFPLPGRRIRAKRCEAEICVARKIFLPCIFLPSLGETGRTGTEVVRPDNGKMVSEVNLYSPPSTRSPPQTRQTKSSLPDRNPGRLGAVHDLAFFLFFFGAASSEFDFWAAVCAWIPAISVSLLVVFISRADIRQLVLEH